MNLSDAIMICATAILVIGMSVSIVQLVSSIHQLSAEVIGTTR